MDSQTLLIVGITVAVCALIGVGAWIAMNQMRSRRLKERFGPEYDHAVDRAQDRDLAEAELQEREQRVKGYHIVPLSEADQAHYERAWAEVQNRFVDDPERATKEGDQLIFDVMEKRGYPVSDFEQAAADLSVDYPLVVENYRAASVIAQRNRRGEADTEELRQALVRYRALFHELVETQPSERPEPRPAPRRAVFGTSQLRRFTKSKFTKKSSRGGLRS